MALQEIRGRGRVWWTQTWRDVQNDLNRSANCYSRVGKLAISIRTKQTSTLESSNSIPRHIPKRNESICSLKDMCENVPGGTHHNHKKSKQNKLEGNPNACWWWNGWINCGVSTQCSIGCCAAMRINGFSNM